MKRRSFVVGLAGLASSGVVDLESAPHQAVESEIIKIARGSAAQLRIRRAPAQVFEENAIARDILAKTFGGGSPNPPTERYKFLHRSLETVIRRTLPPGQEFSRFNAQAFRRLPPDDPLRRELGLLTNEVFVRKMLRVAGVRDAAPVAAAPPNTCLVLSGGGTKGSFEVGFLAYLKKLWGVLNVTVVCGTSVGAVNAVPIAQSGPAGIDRLVDLWLGLRTDSDMYVPHPSLDLARNELERLGIRIKDFTDILDAKGLERLADAILIDLSDEAAGAAVSLGGMVSGAVLGGPWGPFFVLSGLVGLGIAGGLTMERMKTLGKVFSTLFTSPGLNSFSPLRELIKLNLDVRQLGQPGKPKLRLAMVCLEDGDLYYFCETGELLQGSANSGKAVGRFWRGAVTPSKVREAVIASSSPPMLFPAVPLSEDHGDTSRRRTKNFVDGGLREVLPVRAAVDLGCERVIGVVASALQMGGEEYSTSPPAFFSTALRTVNTMLNEVTRSDMEYIKDSSMRILSHPMTEVIDSFTVDPGLIRINIDYGYMRGFDATLDLAGKQLGVWQMLIMFLAEEEIIRLRKEIWALEQAVAFSFFRGNPPREIPVFNQGILTSIRTKKRELMDATLMRFHAANNDRDSLPVAIDGSTGPMTSIHNWWKTWEKHTPGFLSDSLARNGLWTRLRIGVTGPGGTQDVLEAPGSVPAAPNTTEF
jgi:NTE family protein